MDFIMFLLGMFGDSALPPPRPKVDGATSPTPSQSNTSILD